MRELLKRDWHVIGTVRGEGRTGLHEVLDQVPDRLEIETIDIARAEEIVGLRRRLDGRAFDLVFVVAGVANHPKETIAEVSADEFTRVMQTNALGAMRAVEAFSDLAKPDGVVAVMSSILGSISENRAGGWEVYRASKAALNMLMRSFAVREGRDRSLLIVAPGWVRTDMGGSAAPLDVETSMRGVADVIASRLGKPGLVYLDYTGKTVAW